MWRHRGKWALGIGAGLALLAAPALRILLLLEKDLPWTLLDGRGLLSDLAVSVPVTALVVWLGRSGRAASTARALIARAGAAVVALAWAVLNVVNYEHIRVFDAAVQPTYAAYLGDATFLQGSALKLTHPWPFAAALLVLVGSVITLPRMGSPPASSSTHGRRVRWLVLAAVPIAVLLALLPMHPHHLPWRQLHAVPLAARASSWATEPPLPPVTAEAEARVEALYRADLSGTPRFPLPAALNDAHGRRPNVLIVALEGLSGGFLPSLARHQGVESEQAMPRLDRAAEGALLFENFLGPQRQTNRGLWTILCGELPKLQSLEARMSEYVRVPPDARRRCLPRVLADAGYRTEYLQAAPLAFMMKDQFMKGAGFENVRGDGFFTEAYARNRWGVDDRTFFEGAAARLRALDAEAKSEGKPWFATLLTVGTHHPFLVPDGYGKGSLHARAVAHADEAVDGLLRTLRESGIAKDTLIIVTADESAGISRGDDLTRALSQNWLPLVVFAPGTETQKGRVRDLFVQSDLALSVLDYVGLANANANANANAAQGHPFTGRSLFRRYDSPRALYFANTYFRRVHVLDEDAVLSLCTESFTECRSHAVDPERPFGPARRPIAWQPERLEPLRAVVARSVAPMGMSQGPQTLTLTHRDRVELEDGEQRIVFGGQYLTAGAGSRYEVEFELEVEKSDGLVDLNQDLFAGGRVYHRPGIPLLAEGDRVRTRYDFVFKTETPTVEARFNARTVMGTKSTVRIHKAVLQIIPRFGDGSYERLTQTVLDVTRRPRTEGLRFSLDNPEPFRRPRCITEDKARRMLVGRGCKATYAIFGPYAWAVPGSTVRTKFEVEVTRGEASVKPDIVSDLSRERHVTGEPAMLRAGQRTVLETEFRATQRIEALEGRLEIRPLKGETVDFVIRSGELTVQWPEATAGHPVR